VSFTDSTAKVQIVDFKKVLIVTYYWPPAGGPGVQRWLKFAEYLPEYGIEPIVYTPKNPSYPMIDNSLLEQSPKGLEVIKTPIWEPYRLAEFFNPKSKDYKAGRFEKKENQSLPTRLSVYIRGNFFIPDARKFWVKPSVKFLGNYLKENQIDVLITTGPPHSMHLIGLELKRKYSDLKWIADFRDPWTQISYHSELKLTKNSEKKHKELEEAVIKTADCVLATSFIDAENYRKIGAPEAEVITNGFESDDFEIKKKIQNQKFRISYSGNLESARNPVELWKALKELTDQNTEFKNQLEINFYGILSAEAEETIIENELSKYLKKHGYVNHREAVEGIVNSELQLLTNFPDSKSKGIIPGKLFEYLAARNPIISIGPSDGDVSKILNRTDAGKHFAHSDREGMKTYILEVYSDFKSGRPKPESNSIQQFSRKEITGKLALTVARIGGWD